MKDLTQGNIYKNFFFFSIPIVLSSLLSSAFGVINTSIAGQFLGAEGLAATSIASPYTNVIILIGNGYSYGFSVLAGNLFGAKNYERLRRMLYSNILAISAVLAVICALSIVFCTPIFRFLNVEEQIWEASKQYFILNCIHILIWQMGSMYMYCCHAMGETKFPLIVSFASTALTVVGNLLTVAVWDWGVVGIGASTILANALTLICYWLRFRKYFRELGLENTPVRPSLKDVKALASYSLPNIVQQVAMGGTALLIAPVRNGLGYLVVAALSVVARL
jgi:Na+-driven multidrug efflux pump